MIEIASLFLVVENYEKSTRREPAERQGGERQRSGRGAQSLDIGDSGNTVADNFGKSGHLRMSGIEW